MTPAAIKLSEITHEGTFTASVNRDDSTKARLIYKPADGGPERQWDVQLINRDTNATVLNENQARAIATLFSEEAFKTALLDAKQVQPNTPSLQINASQNETDPWEWSLNGIRARKTVADSKICSVFQSVFPKDWEKNLPTAQPKSPPPLAAAAASSRKGSSKGWEQAKVFKGGVTHFTPRACTSSDKHCFTEMKRFGGAADIVHQIMQSQPRAKCGVMIAANSGLPCGQIGKDGHGSEHTLNCTTQEESIMANVLLTQFGDQYEQHQAFMKQSFGQVWGMIDGHTGNSTQTIQGIDFTKTKDSNDYNQTYVLKDCQLSAIKKDSQGEKELKPDTQHPVTLFFADSVNANSKKGSARGTRKRTLNALSIHNYKFFVECIRTKLRSSLDGMIAEGITHPILAKLSCGIYAGNHKGQINTAFKGILAEVLNEQVPGGKSGLTRRNCFQQVILADVCGKDQPNQDNAFGEFTPSVPAEADRDDEGGGGWGAEGGGWGSGKMGPGLAYPYPQTGMERPDGGAAAAPKIQSFSTEVMKAFAAAQAEHTPFSRIVDLTQYPNALSRYTKPKILEKTNHLDVNWGEYPGVNITIRNEDLFDSGAEVIVNAANTYLGGGDGVDGEIHRRGGIGYAAHHGLLKTQFGGHFDRMTSNATNAGVNAQFPQGAAAIIPSGALGSRGIKKVIVVASPRGNSRSGEHGDLISAKTKEEALYNCYLNSLLLAEEQGHTSIAFPCLGIGIYGYPVKQAAPISLRALHDFLAMGQPRNIKTISIHFKPDPNSAPPFDAYTRETS